MARLKNEEVKVLSLSSLGGMLEFYDFIIFVFFTGVIGVLFFPSGSTFWQDISAYSTFAAGYFARPLGGIIMAHFGDKNGRKNMFMLSILLMVIPTFALGFMPTFEEIGVLAPIALILIRILQGIAIGGELPGAWVFVCEHSERKVLGSTMGIFTSAVVSGILLGSIVTLFVHMNFSPEEIKEYAWRIPFILGGIFGIISIFLRRYLSETPVFKEMQALQQTQKMPIKEVVKSHKTGVGFSFLSTWILTGCVVISVLLTPNLLAQKFEIDAISKIVYQIIAIFFLASGNALGGILSDRIGLKNASFLFGGALMFFACLFYGSIVQGVHFDLVLLFYYLMALSAGVMVFTPLILVDSFPAPIRYSGISFSYNISYAIFGGLTPIFFAFVKDDYPFCLGLYMMFLGLLSIVLAVAFVKKFKQA